ncbi:MAG: DUF1566 domain-containing protein [Thermodesulfobacteriota bacterium]
MNPEPVLSTDQKACFDEDGTPLRCAGTGQDGELRTGKAWPEPRFSVSGEIALDLLTGLSWPIDANPAEFPLSFDEALGFIATLNNEAFLSFSDWRIPSRAELFSLASHAQTNPCLPSGHPFANVFNGYCWTSSTLARLPDQAFTVHLGGARVFPAMKQASCLVWPVRGPSPAPAPPGAERFVAAGAWVQDMQTGLFWQKEPPGALRSWKDTLAAARDARPAAPPGRRPRLPNVRELASLVSERDHSPALAAGHPFANVPPLCWSSTTSLVDPAYAWTAYLRDGRIGVGFKRQREFSAWLCA